MHENKYKRWFFALLFFMAVSIVVYALAIYTLYRVPLTALWINNIYKKKEALAANITTNKIVFCGGSSTLFGVMAKEVQKELRVPVLNLATHAGLDTDYILYRAKRSLRAGDIVVLPLEYELFSYAGRPSIVKLEYVLTYDREYLNSLSLFEKLRYVLSVTGDSILRSVKERRLPEIREPGLNNGYTYTSASLNENGDETSNIGNKPFNATPLNMPLGESKERLGMLIIKDFNEWCRKNEIVLYVTFPNTVMHEDYKNIYYRVYFDRLEGYFRKNGIRVIGKPENFFFDKELFYDTYYHLNLGGMAFRTKQLVETMRGLGPVTVLIKKNREQYERQMAFLVDPRILIGINKDDVISKSDSILNADLIADDAPPGMKVEGMRNVEGPYKQWNLPRVRWINHPRAEIAFENLSNFRKVDLMMSFRPQIRPHAKMVLLFNKEVIARYELKDAVEWQDIIIELSLKKGKNVLEFLNMPSSGEGPPPDSLYMLFRRLTLKTPLILSPASTF